MEIHIVQEGETIYSIANDYEVPVTRLAQENGLSHLDGLVAGQALVIAYPEQIYIVQEGDTLLDIANMHQIPLMQLIRNNMFLIDREYIYPGEAMVIRYPTKGRIAINGFIHPFIDQTTLSMALPYLTYVTLFNYVALKEGEIETYYDETETIELAKAYGVAPLMSISTLSILGVPNSELAYTFLLNETYQNKMITNIIKIAKEKGYYGIHLTFLYLNKANLELYQQFLNKLGKRSREEGLFICLTIDPGIHEVNNEIFFNKIDYSKLIDFVEFISFQNYPWAECSRKPDPIISYKGMDAFLEYVTTMISPDKIMIGMPVIGYDWELPYFVGFSKADTLSYQEAVDLARNYEVPIQFDEKSQAPFLEYILNQTNHIVWFIDARTEQAILLLIQKYGLYGLSIWNIMRFDSQLWTIINSQFEIVKVF